MEEVAVADSAGVGEGMPAVADIAAFFAEVDTGDHSPAVAAQTDADVDSPSVAAVADGDADTAAVAGRSIRLFCGWSHLCCRDMLLCQRLLRRNVYKKEVEHP